MTMPLSVEPMLFFPPIPVSYTHLEVTVSTPRDRNSSFDPQFIKKRETILAEGVADRIIGLYAMGNSTRCV